MSKTGSGVAICPSYNYSAQLENTTNIVTSKNTNVAISVSINLVIRLINSVNVRLNSIRVHI